MTQVLDRLSDGPAKRWLAKHLDHADEEFCLIWPFHLASNGYGQIGGARDPDRGKRPPMSTEREIADYDAERTMAFKRIDQECHSSRKRTKERLKWFRRNPSPRG